MSKTFQNNPDFVSDLDLLRLRKFLAFRKEMHMKRPNDMGSTEVDLPPDGYGQWNIEPPDTYASWGEYFACVSHLAIELYKQRNGESSEPIWSCPEN